MDDGPWTIVQLHMNFFDVDSIFFSAMGYDMTFLEFFGTITGAIAVWLSAKASIWSWPVGIVNVILFFFLFFQVQLYPDMFLQVFFFITNILGWWRWANPKAEEADKRKELRVSRMPLKSLLVFSLVTLAGTLLFGAFASNLHELVPQLFRVPSSFPYFDSFVTVISVVATYLMVEKKVECWAAWILADVVATCLYFAKGIKFVGLEYFVFCIVAAFGFWNWAREAKKYSV